MIVVGSLTREYFRKNHDIELPADFRGIDNLWSVEDVKSALKILNEKFIIMTTLAERVEIYINGTGTVTIDWGDGSEIKEQNFPFDLKTGKNVFQQKAYSDGDAHTIIIVGDISYLNCAYNQLTKLDVSQNDALEELCCENNQLTILDVSKNAALINLMCNGNQIAELDVSQNTALKELWCQFNSLTSLDVSRNIALTELYCHFNKLTKLDVSNNIALEELWCEYNQLTMMDISRNSKLKKLDCHKNQLTVLNVNHNQCMLKFLICNNNLFTAAALDALFMSLPVSDGEVPIFNNPGTDDCDASIAENKGWEVIKKWKDEE